MLRPSGQVGMRDSVSCRADKVMAKTECRHLSDGFVAGLPQLRCFDDSAPLW